MRVNAKHLRAEFADVDSIDGRTLVLDEEEARSLMAKARRARVAISWIEIARASDALRGDPVPEPPLTETDRLSSWAEAESFIEIVAGKGLFFSVELESPWETRVARFRSALRRYISDQTTARLPR